MDRRKFIKTSCALGCGMSLISFCNSSLGTQVTSRLPGDKFIYKRKEDLPKKVRLESCSLCQLNCPECHIRVQERANNIAKEFFGYLKFDDFKNFVDDNPQINEIELTNSGEMFLNPELDKIVGYAYDKKVSLVATGVNMNTLSDEMAETLVLKQFRYIAVSIDGATPKTYAIYRRGGNFNKVIANIKKINKYKKIYNSEYPKLTWKFIPFGHNEHEIELAKQKAKKLNMDMWFMPNGAPHYSPIKNLELVKKQTGLFGYCQEMQLEGAKKEGVFRCCEIFNNPQINYDGTFLGCDCNVSVNGFGGVNVFKLGLMKALNSPIIIDAKLALTDFSYKPKMNHICSTCGLYNELKNNDVHLKI